MADDISHLSSTIEVVRRHPRAVCREKAPGNDEPAISDGTPTPPNTPEGAWAWGGAKRAAQHTATEAAAETPTGLHKGGAAGGAKAFMSGSRRGDDVDEGRLVAAVGASAWACPAVRRVQVPTGNRPPLACNQPS